MDLWHQVGLFFSHVWLAVSGYALHVWFWIKHYIESHPDQTLLIAVVVAFLESLPVIGTIFPGSVTMTLVGIFVGRGLVSVGAALLWTTFGAFLGDLLGYFLGRVYCKKIPHWWPFKNKPHWLESGREFFKKHGGKSVILGRFVGPVRSTVPLIAGVFEMTVGKFIFAVIPSAFLWAVAYLIPGVLIGAVSLHMTPGQTTFFLAMGILVIVCLWFLFWLAQRSYGALAQLFNRVFARWWALLLEKPSTKQLAGWLAVPGDRNCPGQLQRIVWFIIAAFVFLFLLSCVATGNTITMLNLPAFNFMQSVRTPALNHFFAAITLMGSPSAMLVLMMLLAGFYAIQRDWKYLFFWLLGVLLVTLAVGFFKEVIIEPRPAGFNFMSHTNGFPSGHTALSTIVFGLLAFWATKKLESGWRSAWRILTVILILLVGVSRLYLGAHWLWDVVGGWALGAAAWLLITILYRRAQLTSAVHYQAFRPWITLLLIVICSGFFVTKNLAREIFRTTPKWKQQSVSFSGWLHSPHRHIPQFLDNRIGKPYLPMNIQWLGDLACVRQQLVKMGWRKANSSWKIGNLIKRITVKNADNQLPILTRLFEGKAPDIVFIKTAIKPDNILELYLWSSRIRVANTDRRLLVGFLNQRNAKHFFNDKSQFKQRVNYQHGNIASRFVSDLGSAYGHKKAIQRSAIGSEQKGQGWVGDTWLIYPADIHALTIGKKTCP